MVDQPHMQRSGVRPVQGGRGGTDSRRLLVAFLQHTHTRPPTAVHDEDASNQIGL